MIISIKKIKYIKRIDINLMAFLTLILFKSLIFSGFVSLYFLELIICFSDMKYRIIYLLKNILEMSLCLFIDYLFIHLFKKVKYQ